MQQYAGLYLLHNHCTCFGCPSHPSSGLHKIVTADSGTGHSIWVITFQLFSYVLLVMGAKENRNLYSDFAVNKYLHTVASY
jgi:hypothetical protein